MTDPAIRAQTLINRFWRALDMRDYSGLIDLLTEDCSWKRDRVIHGKAEILAALEGRPAKLSIRHVVTNLILDAEGSGFSGTYLILAYVGDGEPTPEKSVTPASSPTVIQVTTKLEEVSGRLLVSSIVPEVVFSGGGH